MSDLIITVVVLASVVGYGAVAGIVYRAVDAQCSSKDWPKRYGSPEGEEWAGFAAALWPLLGLPVYMVFKDKSARYKNARLDKEAEELLRKEASK